MAARDQMHESVKFEAELLEHGVAATEIVPAHLPPALRHLMDYAAA